MVTPVLPSIAAANLVPKAEAGITSNVGLSRVFGTISQTNSTMTPTRP